MRLREQEPDAYRAVLLEAVRTDQSDDVVMALGCRLQMLLEDDPGQFIERLEAHASDG